MKHSIFKIRKLNERVDSKAELQINQLPSSNQPKQTVGTLSQKMAGLMNLFEKFMSISLVQNSSNKIPHQDQQPKNQSFQNFQVRDRYVHLDLPIPLSTELSNNQIEKWITELCMSTFSTSFHFYLTGQMTFEQTKIFCSQNVLRNLFLLTERFKLDDSKLQCINEHIGKKVFSYLQKKYPLTQSNDVNKALQRQVQETDHLDLLSNDFLYSSGIMFQYRSEGNYNDMIMKVINKSLEIVDGLSPFEDMTQKQVSYDQFTNYIDFQTYFSTLFEKVYDEQWMFNKIQERQMSDFSKIAKKITDDSHKQKYIEKVKEYTNYLIGRKLSENTHPYDENQVLSKNLIVKSSAILRILTKWCQQLWQKFENENYFTERAEAIQLQKPEFVNPFFKWMKTGIDTLMKKQKLSIIQFKKQLDRNNHFQQSQFLLNHLKQDDINHIPKLEKAAGKYASQMVKNLHTYIVLYLNRLIHGLLTVSKQFYDKQIDKSWDDWQAPPNLITFKIGDLMRCKISSKEKEIIKIFKQIKNISNKNPQKLKIVRIKNRLRQGTNDILINIKFNNLIICQIQLQVINKSKTKFIQCSNSFSHYIYEMKRSIFGPISEMCNIWNNYEPRSSSFYNLIKITDKQPQKCPETCIDETGHNFENIAMPFQCSSCKNLYYHNNYIFSNQKCSKCKLYKCVRCQKNQMKENELKSKIFVNKKDQQISKSCIKLITKEIPKFGVCVKIQSKIINIEIFTYKKIEGRAWILGQKDGKIYDISKIKNKSDQNEFLLNYCIFNINITPQKFIKISDNTAYFFTVGQYLKHTYKQQKQVLILTQIRFTVPQMIELMKIDGGFQKNKKKIKRIQYASNYINQLSYFNCFENLTILNLDYNKFPNMQGVSHFKYLEKLQMRQNADLAVFNQEICQLGRLEEIKLSKCKLTAIPQSINKLQMLRIFKMDNNQVRVLPQNICELVNLKEISLNANKLKEIPANIGKMTNLRKIFMKNNEIEALPQSFAQLINLTNIDFSTNKISLLCSTFKNFTKLEYLKLGHNKLTILPDDLTQSQFLKQVTLQSNDIQILPDNFSKCKILQILDISVNKIQKLPESLSSCVNLQKFSILSNKIEIIPEWLKKCNKLSQIFNITNNCLKVFPNCLLEMDNISELRLDSNEINQIPASITTLQSLKSLTLRKNKIKTLPENIFQLTNTSFDFRQNEIQKIPQSFYQNQNNHAKIQNVFYGNKITLIQPSFFTLITTNTIKFTHNMLLSLPIFLIANKTIIKFLDFNHNKIREIPCEIKQFINLQQLNLSYNEIQIVPIQVKSIPMFVKYPVRLNLNNNPIKLTEEAQILIQENKNNPTPSDSSSQEDP